MDKLQLFKRPVCDIKAPLGFPVVPDYYQKPDLIKFVYLNADKYDFLNFGKVQKT